ncbi:neurotrimin isoform X2 [Zeugodacus cucurbitae]|uniref:neurotrimin isoform X2 n=1 Tax=Zeugodacus cucurbitae TaxID=28588 RepID=UPI0023D9032A|nr:neurotrimin isoform X2 [Zeugodacus cucurbitae]
MMTTAIETTFVTRQVASTSVTTLIGKSSKSNRTNPPATTPTQPRTPTETRDRPQSLCTRSTPKTTTTTGTTNHYYNQTTSPPTTTTSATGRRMRRLLNAHLVITATTLQQCAAVRWQLLVAFLICNCIVGAFEPDFVFPLENVTVAQGRDATFTCVVNNLGGHRVSGDSATARVAWIKADAKAILAIHEHVITNNDRLSVTHNDFNTWTLVIRNVKMEDSGKYMCQVNTDPMKMQTATLEVVIPPDIINEETSGDMMVPEGGSAKLVCRARGHPKPKITWRREDGREIIARNGAHQKTKALAVEGEMLALTKVTRSEMGAYMCIASNGVPPSVSKRMKLQVHFHPLVQVPNQLVGAPVLTDVTLVCNVEASPKAINYWQRENGEMIIAGDRYVLTEKENNMYSIEMILHIRRLQTSDFGGYKCISKNSIGDTEGTIRLYEMERPGKKNQREDDNEVTKNDASLKDNRHEDGSRNQNGRLYKERGSDAELQSAGQTLSRRSSTIYLLVLALFVSLVTSATTATITTNTAVTMVSRRSFSNL